MLVCLVVYHYTEDFHGQLDIEEKAKHGETVQPKQPLKGKFSRNKCS